MGERDGREDEEWGWRGKRQEGDMGRGREGRRRKSVEDATLLALKLGYDATSHGSQETPRRTHH